MSEVSDWATLLSSVIRLHVYSTLEVSQSVFRDARPSRAAVVAAFAAAHSLRQPTVVVVVASAALLMNHDLLRLLLSGRDCNAILHEQLLCEL